MKTYCKRYYISIIIPFFVVIPIFIMLFSCKGSGNEAMKKTDSALKAEADSLLNVMFEYSDAHRFAEAVELGNVVLKKYEELKDTAGLSDVLGELSADHMRLGNGAEGLEYSFRAIEMDSIMKNYDYLSGDYNTIAAIFMSEGKAPKAEPFILRAIEYEKLTQEKSHLSNRYGIASEIYCKMRRIKDAINYAAKGLEIAVEKNDTAQIATRMSQLGDAYFADKRYDDAEKVYKKCIDMMQSPRSMISLAITYKQLGSICDLRKEAKQAAIYYEKGADLARKTQYTVLLVQCTQALGELVADSHPVYAVQLLKESRALADSMHSHKVEDLMASFAAKFDKQEKERIIAEQSESLRMHKRVIFGGAIFLVLLMFIIVLYVFLKRIRQRNMQLEADLSRKVVEEAQHIEQPAISDANQEFLDGLAKYVKEHISDSELSTNSLAEEFCMSPRQFSRRVKLLTGIDTTHYIRASRMLQARQLLQGTSLPISEIYVKCGFESANYFSRVFRQDVGISPTEYRERSVKND